MNVYIFLLPILVIFISLLEVQAWSGNYCSQVAVRYEYYYVCVHYSWWSCCYHKLVWRPVYYTNYFCCPGWTTSTYQNCNIPVCNPPCQNGGTCTAPNQCRCQVQNTGPRCDGSVCSHLSPCYPGTCQIPDICDCDGAFSTPSTGNTATTKQNYCLQVDDNKYTELQIYQMQVRMSYWPRDITPSMQKYQIMGDSTNLNGDTDFFWTNRKDFNRLETNCSSQFFPPTLPPRPLYIGNASFGIVKGEIEVWLSKLPIPPSTDRYQSLNKTIPCTNVVSSNQPETQLYMCDIVDPNFDRFLEHGDFLTITYKTTGGGFRQVLNRNNAPPTTHLTQTYLGVNRSLAVLYKFDFRPPFHCEENVPNACISGETMLQVPDITKNSPINIVWSGWQDNDSKMFRYSMEVFKMTKTIDNELEIKPELALKPLINREVMHENLTVQQYTFPEPGMYSIILEASDLANNSKYVRRLCLFDPSSEISTDSRYGLYVSSASEAANFTYQNNRNVSIVVTWDQYFRNVFHEMNSLLGAVREYPRELEDSKKTIPKDSPLDDNEGPRTIHAVPNKNGIIKFQVAYEKDHDGGLNQPAVPTQAWTDVYLNTSFIVPFNVFPSEADTLTIWINALDFVGNQRIERTKVTFDSTPPLVQNLDFHLNEHVPEIDFSSKLSVSAQDSQSGIAFISWTFTRKNGAVLYHQQVPGKRILESECTDFKVCTCTTAKECFPHEQFFALSNCHLMVEKDSLAIENITIIANVTNMAGLVTTRTTHKSDLRSLNGTQAYFPPQNINVKSITAEGVTLTWNFPPSCFRRTELWVVVDSDKRVVHKDAVQFDLTGLRPSTNYTIYMITHYEGGETSDPQPFSFRTAEADADGISGGAIAGIIIGVLILLALVAFISLFLLWRKGVIFQDDEGRMNTVMKRTSMAFSNIRKTMKYRHHDPETPSGACSNNAYHSYDPSQDEVHVYGNMNFTSKQKWQLDPTCLKLGDHITDGRFAKIFKASLLKKHGHSEIVVAKMLKPGFTEDDEMKMKAKINFWATQLKVHENILKFIGAVTTSAEWGPVMVIEYCPGGQLDTWLIAQRPKEGTDMIEIMEKLYEFSLGIAKAMEFLAALKVTHKRLAARNILLSAENEVKVAGFGPQETESKGDINTRLPVKWVAIEIIEEKPASEMSDVWSFGVVLWEIFSMGEKPYPNIHSSEMATRLKEGYRMQKPEYAEEMFYQLMTDCWQEIPGKRPTFKTIRKQLTSLYTSSKTNSSVYYDVKTFH